MAFSLNFNDLSRPTNGLSPGVRIDLRHVMRRDVRIISRDGQEDGSIRGWVDMLG